METKTPNQFKEKYMNDQPHNNPDYKAPEMRYRQGDIIVDDEFNGVREGFCPDCKEHCVFETNDESNK